jgi:hypothetical protein
LAYGRSVEQHSVEVGFVDLLGAVADGVVGGVINELVEAADHAAGAGVQVVGLFDQGSGFVLVQAKGLLHRGDELDPVLFVLIGAVGEGSGLDRDEAAEDLPPANSGEQVGFIEVQPCVDERRCDGVVIFS